MYRISLPRRLLLVVIAGLSAGIASAGMQTTASITGTVTEEGTGTGIEGATVVVTSLSFEELASATTDTEGDYTLEVDAAEGPVEVLVEAAGPEHAMARHGAPGVERCRFGPRDSEAPGSMTLEAGDAITGIDLELESGGWISGKVAAEGTGEPLQDVDVELYASDGTRCGDRFHGVSDSTGEYETGLAVPAGAYHLLARPTPGDNFVAQAWNGFPCPYGSCPIVQGDPLDVSTAGVTSDVDFDLEPGATIKGTLLPDDIQRLVFLFNGAGWQMLTRPVPDFGESLPAEEWSINGLSGGSYYIQLGPFNLDGGPIEPGSPYVRVLHNGLLCPWGGCNRARGVPITIPSGSTLELPATTLETGGWVEGVLIDADTGEPPTGVTGGTVLGAYDVIDQGGDVVAGGPIVVEDGEVVLAPSAAMPPGDYRVRTYQSFRGDGVGYSHADLFADATLPGYSDAMYPDVACAGLGCDVSQAATVSVEKDEGTSVTIELSSGSHISGTVTDADTGEGIEDAVVKLVDSDNELLAATAADNDGHYDFGGFPPGDYYVRTSMGGRTGVGTRSPQLAYFDKVYGAPGECSEQRCDPATGTAITLDGENDASDIDLAVPEGPVISGRVIFALTGLPIQLGTVRVRDEEGTFVGSYRINPGTARYQTTALPPGDYTLEADVSPAFADISTTSSTERPVDSEGRFPTREASLQVTVGNESVEADLTVIDPALDRIFQSDFKVD